MVTFRWPPISVTHSLLILEMLSFEAMEENDKGFTGSKGIKSKKGSA